MPDEFRHDLVLQPSPSLTVRLVGPEGKPLTNVTVWGRFPHDRDFGDKNLYDQSRTQISGLDPARREPSSSCTTVASSAPCSSSKRVK